MSRCPHRRRSSSSNLPPPIIEPTLPIVATAPTTATATQSPKMTIPEPYSAPLPLPPNSNVANATSSTPTTYIPSLLTAVPSIGHTHLLVGHNALAAARCTRSLECGASVILVTPSSPSDLHYNLQSRIASQAITHLSRDFRSTDLTTLGREEVDNVVDAVFITLDPVYAPEVAGIVAQCRRLRIPVNVADSSSLSSFTLLSTYSDGPLQVGVTTSGMGCKLASRLRRTVAGAFPAGMGGACERLGRLRRRIWEEDCVVPGAIVDGPVDAVKTPSQGRKGISLNAEEEDSGEQKATFNNLIDPEEAENAKSRRIRWLSQICEYYPLEKLVGLTDADLDTLFNEYVSSKQSQDPNTDVPLPSLPLKKGTITLVGSGPGDPNLLTTAALTHLQTAHLVLADKLVPAAVLNLIPRRTPLFIARKFPGNADAAQEELLQKGLEAVLRGENVVRLKQGDPYIYGRGGEEYTFFEKHGVKVDVIPGITSALSGPLFAGIPLTQRGVADQVLICTGTGRKGAAPEAPVYIESQTTVFLMACHRLKALVDSLLVEEKGWKADVPCAVVERASCADQRVVRSTLGGICAAVEEVGMRPPGLFVVGWACNVLKGKDVGEKGWVVEEGV